MEKYGDWRRAADADGEANPDDADEYLDISMAIIAAVMKSQFSRERQASPLGHCTMHIGISSMMHEKRTTFFFSVVTKRLFVSLSWYVCRSVCFSVYYHPGHGKCMIVYQTVILLKEIGSNDNFWQLLHPIS